MQYRHTREWAQNKPHLSSSPEYPHLTIESSSCPQRYDLHAPTRALILNESLYRPHKSHLSQRRATPYVYHSKAAPNSEIPASQERTTQTSVVERRPNATKAPSRPTSIPSNMQASTCHVYKRIESLKLNQYYKRQQVRNNIHGASSQEPSPSNQASDLRTRRFKASKSQAKQVPPTQTLSMGKELH
jgi:hypothetical protein